MKRNILMSLMIIGAVAALISGATFSAFTDSQTIDGTVTFGNVTVDVDDVETLTWTPDPDCTNPSATTPVVGSDAVCSSTVTVTYGGDNPENALPADMDIVLTISSNTNDCFEATLEWDGDTEDDGPSSAITGSISFLDLTAEDGTVTVTAQLDPSYAGDVNDCQNASLVLDLTISTAEI